MTSHPPVIQYSVCMSCSLPSLTLDHEVRCTFINSKSALIYPTFVSPLLPSLVKNNRDKQQFDSAVYFINVSQNILSTGFVIVLQYNLLINSYLFFFYLKEPKPMII